MTKYIDSEEYLNDKVPIPKSHSLKYIGMHNECKRGHDTDIYQYEELDENGVVVAEHIIYYSTCIYPPFDLSIHHESRKV